MRAVVKVAKYQSLRSGLNYVATCLTCPPVPGDLSGADGVSKSHAEQIKAKHLKEVHGL